MAENSTAAVQQDVANLHLDDVTGERVSKSELKKRQKQRETERKKAEKAAAAPPKTEKKKKAGADEIDESQLNPNVCWIWSQVLSWSSARHDQAKTIHLMLAFYLPI